MNDFQHVRCAGVQDHQSRTATRQNVPNIIECVRVQRHEIRANLSRGEPYDQELRPLWKKCGDDVAPADTAIEQTVRDAIDRCEELGGGPESFLFVDQRNVRRVPLRMLPEVERWR